MIHSDVGLYFFQGFTLVDITATGVIRGTNPDAIDRNQQRNWETVIQCMSLRTQPQYIQEPMVVTIENIGVAEFGDFYQGTQKIWTWSWAVETPEIYDLHSEPLLGLQQDFEQVPIVTGLDETAKFMLPIFYPYGTIKNIYFNQLIPS